MKYLVNLMNQENNGMHISFGDGHGFEVKASSMEDAKSKVIERAKRDGFYGKNDYWSANIIKLQQNGRRVERTCIDAWAKIDELDAVIQLTDTPRL